MLAIKLLEKDVEQLEGRIAFEEAFKRAFEKAKITTLECVVMLTDRASCFFLEELEDVHKLEYREDKPVPVQYNYRARIRMPYAFMWEYIKQLGDGEARFIYDLEL